MCTYAEVAMAAFQTISAHNDAVDAANAQNARYRQNVQNARVAFEDETRATNRRIGQEQDAAAQEKFNKQIEALEKSGEVQVSAGEAGVAGNSVRALFNDVERRKAMAQGTIARNTDMKVAQLNDQKQASVNTFMNRVNSVQKAKAPSTGDALQGFAMNLAGSAIGSEAMSSSNNAFIKKINTPIFQ